MILHRVFPYDENAEADEPGNALFAPRNGAGRADNPGAYVALYCASTQEAAVAEAFGRIPSWNASMLRRPDGRRYALAAIDCGDDDGTIYNLDDAQHLIDESLRPSQVVTRDRAVTQAWAMRIFEKSRYDGVAWWSFYKPEWLSVALWDLTRLRLQSEPQILSISDDVLRSAGREIMRITRR